MASTAIVVRGEQDEKAPAPVRDRFMAHLEGGKRLRLAVLERAVCDFRTYADVPTARGRWLFREVAAWFDSSATGPFDFEGICQGTGLDPDFVRKGLRSACGTQRPQLHTMSGGDWIVSSSRPAAGAVQTGVDRRA
jgi:hypothetical protein